MLLSCFRIILLVTGLRIHCHCTAGQHLKGTVFRPHVNIVYVAADIKGELSCLLGSIPIRIGHRHCALAHIFGAQVPAVFIAVLYSDNILIGHGDVCDYKFKIAAVRIFPVFHVAVLFSVDPLVPPGQQITVAEIEVSLYFGLSDVKIALAAVTDLIVVHLRADCDFDPRDPHFSKLLAVDIEALLLRRYTHCACRIRTFRAVMVLCPRSQRIVSTIKPLDFDRAAPFAVIKQIPGSLVLSDGDPVSQVIQPVFPAVCFLIIHKRFYAERSFILLLS